MNLFFLMRALYQKPRGCINNAVSICSDPSDPWIRFAVRARFAAPPFGRQGLCVIMVEKRTRTIGHSLVLLSEEIVKGDDVCDHRPICIALESARRHKRRQDALARLGGGPEQFNAALQFVPLVLTE